MRGKYCNIGTNYMSISDKILLFKAVEGVVKGIE